MAYKENRLQWVLMALQYSKHIEISIHHWSVYKISIAKYGVYAFTVNLQGHRTKFGYIRTVYER